MRNIQDGLFMMMAAMVAVGMLMSPVPARAQVANYAPVTDQVLASPAAGDWLSWRRDHTVSAYSPLDQITKQNVKNLKLVWMASLDTGPNEQEPLAYNGVMFLPHSNGLVQAVDGSTGEVIWEYRRRLPRDQGNDTTRNLALYGDKIYLTSPDAYMVALDARTGKMVWETKTGDPDDRVAYSAGPIVADGRVFAGQTCGVGTSSSCALSGFDAETGKLLWTRESVAGPSDPPEHDATWGGAPYDKRRKASFWLTGSYDPELKLVYWSTASAYPYPEMHKGTGGGALLYTNSILALEAATGEIRWYFQMQPRDNFDMDHEDNPILADVEVDGVRRKAVFVLGKPGIQWAFDRETGQYLWHKQLVPQQNLYKSIDSRTGAIVMNTDIIPTKVGDRQMVCPGMRGGKLFQTNAYSPRTNALYSPVSNECTIFEVMPIDQFASGVRYSEIRHMEGAGGNVGSLVATSASTGEELWRFDQRAAMGSVMTTGGGLVFAGDLHRTFRAFDATTGEVLWEIPLNGPITGYPMTYMAGGIQYVAVAAGGRTSGERHLAELYPEMTAVGGSNILAVFAVQ